MNDWWQLAVAVVGGLLVLWLGLVGVLWWAQRGTVDKAGFRDLLRLAPDVVRLLQRLARDSAVSPGVRVWLALLTVYLLSPIDLIPDFIPVLGFADDAIVAAVALRFATRRAGSAAVERHWPGTPEGLAAVLRLAGLRSAAVPS